MNNLETQNFQFLYFFPCSKSRRLKTEQGSSESDFSLKQPLARLEAHGITSSGRQAQTLRITCSSVFLRGHVCLLNKGAKTKTKEKRKGSKRKSYNLLLPYWTFHAKNKKRVSLLWYCIPLGTKRKWERSRELESNERLLWPCHFEVVEEDINAQHLITPRPPDLMFGFEEEREKWYGRAEEWKEEEVVLSVAMPAVLYWVDPVGEVLREEDKMKQGLSICLSRCPFMSSYLHEGLS